MATRGRQATGDLRLSILIARRLSIVGVLLLGKVDYRLSARCHARFS